MIRDIIDMHTHTIASGHAYNTVYEMAKSAADKGASILGISDHAPAMEGSASRHYFRANRHVPRELYGVQILFGAELNIMDFDGAVDLEEEFAAPLDYAIASMHIECIRPGSITDHTSAYLAVMQNPKVLIIGHPDDGTFEPDYEKIASAAAENQVLIELNEVSVHPGSYRKNARQNAYRMLSACRRYNTNIIVSSDAHCETEILMHHYALQMLQDIQFPEELIVNSSTSKLMDCIHARREYVS